MSTTSIVFLAFASFCALLCGVSRNAIWQRAVMFAANLVFLASFTTSPRAYAPYLVFIAVAYAAIQAMRRFRSTGALWAGVLLLLAVFCWLKQYWFLSFVDALHFPYATIGLSYVFFRVMALLIDTHADPELGRVGPIEYFNFAMNFPTLVAGPIDRFQNFSTPYQRPALPVIGAAVERIVLGIFKIIAVSALVGAAQSDAFARLFVVDGAMRVWSAAVALGIYPIYLYFNFSGYSDIVIAFGRLLGKVYPENFNSPFVATSFLEFWTRWHMSLSNWLRDYVYTPLLIFLMKNVKKKGVDAYLGVVAYFVTFFIIGIWHGSTVIFAVYGILLALGVSVNKLWQLQIAKKLGKKQYKQLSASFNYRVLSRALTYTWYCLCMLCFWATGEQALHFLSTLGPAESLLSSLVILLVALVASALYEAWSASRWTGIWPALTSNQAGPYFRASAAGFVVFLCIASLMLSQGKAPGVIYQAF